MTDEQIEATLQRNATNIGGFDGEVLHYINRLKTECMVVNRVCHKNTHVEKIGFIEAIQEAQKEAFKRNIMANAIFISKEFVATNEFVLSCFRTAHIVKPMILGLKAEITNDLPDGFAFALLEVDAENLMTEHEKKIRKDTAKEILLELKEMCPNCFEGLRFWIDTRLKKFGVEVDE